MSQIWGQLWPFACAGACCEGEGHRVTLNGCFPPHHGQHGACAHPIMVECPSQYQPPLKNGM